MCFYSEPDWYAEIVEEQDLVAGDVSPGRCDECYRPVAPGSPYHIIRMQEYETCQGCEACEELEGDDWDVLCRGEDPNLGETFEYRRCHECHLFLEAVEAAELAAGCRRSDSRPDLTGMVEQIGEGGREEAAKYFRQALRSYPQLRASGYLGWLYKEIFG